MYIMTGRTYVGKQRRRCRSTPAAYLVKVQVKFFLPGSGEKTGVAGEKRAEQNRKSLSGGAAKIAFRARPIRLRVGKQNSGLFPGPYRMRDEHSGRRAERDHNMRPVTGEVRYIANHNTNDRANSGTKRDLDGTHIILRCRAECPSAPAGSGRSQLKPASAITDIRSARTMTTKATAVRFVVRQGTACSPNQEAEMSITALAAIWAHESNQRPCQRH